MKTATARKPRKSRRVQEPVVMFNKTAAQIAGSKASAFPVIFLPKHSLWVTCDPNGTTWAKGTWAGLADRAVIHVLPGASDLAAAISRQVFPSLIGSALMNNTAARMVFCGPGRVKVQMFGLCGHGGWATFNFNTPRSEA